MKKLSLVLLGLVFGIVLAASSPIVAKTAKKVFKQKTVYEKVINVRKGIKNKKGKVYIKDGLKVKGKASMAKSLTVSGNLIVKGTAKINKISNLINDGSFSSGRGGKVSADAGSTWKVVNYVAAPAANPDSLEASPESTFAFAPSSNTEGTFSANPYFSFDHSLISEGYSGTYTGNYRIFNDVIYFYNVIGIDGNAWSLYKKAKSTRMTATKEKSKTTMITETQGGTLGVISVLTLQE